MTDTFYGWRTILILDDALLHWSRAGLQRPSLLTSGGLYLIRDMRYQYIQDLEGDMDRDTFDILRAERPVPFSRGLFWAGHSVGRRRMGHHSACSSSGPPSKPLNSDRLPGGGCSPTGFAGAVGYRLTGGPACDPTEAAGGLEDAPFLGGREDLPDYRHSAVTGIHY